MPCTLASAAREAFEAERGCRATGKPGASEPRRRRTGRRATGRVRPARPWRGRRRSGRCVRSSRAVHSRATAGAGQLRPVRIGTVAGGPIGVGVVVEEQVEPGRGPEVEQGKRLLPSRTARQCGRGRAAARSSARPRWSGSSGWRSAARSRRGARGRSRRTPPRRHLRPAVRPGVPRTRPRCRRTRPSGCVGAGESRRKCTAASSSSGRRWGSGAPSRSESTVFVVGDAAADARGRCVPPSRSTVAAKARKWPAERLVGEHALARSWRGAAG